ncbi:hypothetical protein [Anatilimnocola floriformis]|uniref:hypothetical protein n=1 Tax=Anatilimnocola floriformis TaxID=2948575 RepID=UPI0020C4B503|nr:hypothetical protein [Anatilimnocola floriformis]
MDEPEPKKRRKNRKPSEADVGSFLRQYTRKRQANGDPNDRHYSRKVEAKIKAMKPEELDQLLRDENLAADESAHDEQSTNPSVAETASESAAIQKPAAGDVETK